jgi:hypothetical protein
LPSQCKNFLAILKAPQSNTWEYRCRFQSFRRALSDIKLAWRGHLMHRSKRLTLIKTTLCAVPIYTSISLGLPQWLYRALRKVMTMFLWTCSDLVQKEKCLVAWQYIERPLHLGGLGVMNLKRLGMALCLRWMWFHRIDPSRPWSSLPITEDKCTTSFFNASLKITLGNGKDVRFWFDPWLHGTRVCDRWSDLAVAVPMRHRRKLTVEATLHNGAWIRDIYGALMCDVSPLSNDGQS